jgi:hypothetical protein
MQPARPTVEVLEHLLETARILGYSIRHVWLGGSGGGACEIRGKKWIFIDLSLCETEQLAQIAEGLEHEPAFARTALCVEIRGRWSPRRAA